MNRQQLFNTAVTHLIAQGKLASPDGFTCCYRTDDGLMCALGVNIPDNQYDPVMEGAMPAFDHGPAPALVARVLGAKTDDDTRFLRDLQAELHDELYYATDFPAAVKAAAKAFAANHNLEMPA